MLASLRGQDKRFNSERQRQLELAKLRREQKKIAKEDKFDAAALVLGIAKQQEATREARYDVMYICVSYCLVLPFPRICTDMQPHQRCQHVCCSYRKDRARHEKLARERLAALKAKRAAKDAAIVVSDDDEQRHAIEAKLQEEHDRENDLLSQEALELQKGGIVAVQETILKEVEKKHSIEIKVMISPFLSTSYPGLLGGGMATQLPRSPGYEVAFLYDLTVSRKPGTFNLPVFNHLYLLFPFIKFVET